MCCDERERESRVHDGHDVVVDDVHLGDNTMPQLPTVGHQHVAEGCSH